MRGCHRSLPARREGQMAPSGLLALFPDVWPRSALHTSDPALSGRSQGMDESRSLPSAGTRPSPNTAREPLALGEPWADSNVNIKLGMMLLSPPSVTSVISGVPRKTLYVKKRRLGTRGPCP